MITGRRRIRLVQKGLLVRARLVVFAIVFAVLSGNSLVAEQAPAPNARNADDPHGVLLKPIPDRLVVLTFDDGPVSGCTVVAPILKPYGFNGSFYVCDFDSFKTRKDWYLTWRQMKELADQGFEIGNHSRGHGSGLNQMIDMEDALLANGVPKPTTIAWPLHMANLKEAPQLAADGYLFARGGYFRPYRPTADHPFDIPCLGASTMEEFVKSVRQAAGGKIAVLIYHGVPDMEHPPVSLAPELFKVQMQYLKDNEYKVIALRDLAEYIDPEKASKLPPTARELKETGPLVLAEEKKPCGVVNLAKPEVKNAGKTPERKTTEKPPAPLGEVKPLDSKQPNVFTWSKAEAGSWSDAAKWSSNLNGTSAPLAGGQTDYVVHFGQRGPCAVKNDLNAGFLLNRLILGDNCGGLVVSGNGLTFTKDRANGVPPAILAGKCQRVDFKVPMKLQDDLQVNTSSDRDPNCFISFHDVISGPGALMLNSSGESDVARINFHDVHFGILQINTANTYSGGTIINGGKINVRKADGLGTGPVTLDHFGTLCSDGTLANPLTINDGTLFHCSSSGPVQLNGTARFIGNCTISGGMSGAGGFTMLGTNGTYLNIVPGGTVTLHGANTYSGPTEVFPGTLIVKKAAGLYHADTVKWTPANIALHKAATLRLSVGGPGEFTGEQIGVLLKNLTTAINENGIMGGSFVCLDAVNAKDQVTVSADISDSKGPGGGAFVIKKCGAGTMQLSGKNAYTGQTILEDGTLSVSSLNSFGRGKSQPFSSLGAPTDIESGEIVMGVEGKDSDCSLIYTGAGETSDRVMNLAGKKSTVTFDQSGTGLFKLTSTFVISGYGASKTIVLTGSTAGTGELAGDIQNLYDRKKTAVTALTKTGTGTWILSGANTFTGPTKVEQGTLALANPRSLSASAEVSVADGAKLELRFEGEMQGSKLSLGGKAQPAGQYRSAGTPDFIKGTGVLNVKPAKE